MNWVKDSVLLAQELLSHSPPCSFCIFSTSIKWIVIFIDIAQIFSSDQNVTGLTCDEFHKPIDCAVVVNFGDDPKNITDNAASVNCSATSKVEYIGYNNLPGDVKVAYLHNNEGTYIIRDDIEKFQNDLVEDTRG